jgi:hypothetical protein
MPSKSIKKGNRSLSWFCITALLLLQPLMMRHLQTHLGGRFSGATGMPSSACVAAENSLDGDCALCHMFQGLSRVFPMAPSSLLFFFMLIASLAFRLLPSPGGRERQIYRLRGPPLAA